MNFKQWFVESAEINQFLSLINAVKTKKWIPLNRREAHDFWQNDGDLIERWSVTSPTELHKVQLNIPVDHANGLKGFADEIVEFYNAFDIWLKETYHMNIVDFIDYDAGIVFLIKPIKYNL